MKRYLLNCVTVMMMAVVSLGFVSCGDDDGPEGPDNEYYAPLQGTWQFQKGTETVMGMTIDMDRSTMEELRSQMEQMSGTRVEFWDETLYFSGMKVNGVTYNLKGNKIILDGMDAMKGFSVSIKSISSSKLVLHEVISMQGLEITADIEYSRY
ncbi:MAG: hypothetical protein IJ606_06350 [Bacteroidaceae bacterium]|nr:hypothetical protein [Bacteroidaceae bacterium]